MGRHGFGVVVTALALGLVTRAVAQEEIPTPEVVGRAATQLAKRLELLQNLEGDHQKEIAEASGKIDEFATAVAEATGFQAEHFVAASSPLLEVAPKACLAIAEHGVKAFPTSRFLWDHAGMARLKLAMGTRPRASRTAELQVTEQAFRKGIALQPDTFHAHLGLAQALRELGRPADALAELEVATKDDDGVRAAPTAWLLRAGLLMQCGKAKDAAAILSGDEVTDDLRPVARQLLLRAHALNGDAAAATALIAELRKDEPGMRSLIDAADALAFLGKKAEALQLLAQRTPLGEWKSEQERKDQLLSQNAAAMEAFWKATDVSAAGPLRAALLAALDHHIVIAGAGKPGEAPVDLASSPPLLADMLATMPSEPDKDWANDVLFVLCLRAPADPKPNPLAAKMQPALNRGKPTGAADVPAVLTALRTAVGDPGVPGALTGLRAVEKLEAKPDEKPGAKKPEPAKPDPKKPAPKKK